MSMTDDEIRIAIAESVGLLKRKEGESVEYQDWRYTKDIPDYARDLNAMHEIESSLDLDHEDSIYWFKLDFVCKRDKTVPIRATAHQRAEAFLQTIGKWRES